ncbi:ABC-2 type transport system permease protein [Actinopolyspora lacussalsi subsp. righensis]|uniref:Transport permease protein n=1 Tax=Actinopolyspora righensis TaxID=995060 RepID=A0A1I6Y8X4_9ACTN|nr:ABC transporter permease [Actinopolyspora righensis]SFT46850.1 ABC-2 type transport system permease protein [Actinopolyspora righensis]
MQHAHLDVERIYSRSGIRRGARHELRSVLALWQRELVRMLRNRAQLIFTLISPLLFLVVIGTGVDTIAGRTGGTDMYLTFLFPGILVFAVQATSISAGLSLVRDRESGLLRGMLVAPVHRATLVAGKCLGGATAAAVQGALLLALAGFVGLSYDPRVLILLFLVLTLISVSITAVGALGAVTVKRAEAFQSMVAVMLMPMYLLSGAMFSVRMLPDWLAPLVLLNPLTYAVDALRRTAMLGVDAGRSETTFVNWGGWVPPVGLEIVAMCLLSLSALALATRRFARVE